ncbi:hypothetical protein CY34DRAFT_82326 [Suillus luteus UH-Slu-Lm8-n1]|uniref:F-box domain-containing protein n=1 Tax=Suillus luteus UH-Slu-Lm8-n1 TaxID=930992 RepID=A0A0D0B9W9_9AGAM|nr:hypothetical protein CY34DRAFT_82326 [Suillus luteus UH-Slu-Lm8-n1]
MHQAFYSDDIVYSILKHLRFSPTSVKNVAMTCSSLAAPALDFLWSEHSSLAPLIMCLPSDTLEITDRTINLTGEPTPNEWARVRLNASRVRRISDWDPVSYNFFYPKLRVSGLVLRKLFEQFPPATLFPNLCAFNSNALEESCSDLMLVREFLSPALEALWLDAGSFSMDEMDSFFDALPEEADGLRELSISVDNGEMPTEVLEVFGELPRLIKLSLCGVDVLTRQALTNIQQARGLKTLKLAFPDEVSCEGGFRALEFSSLEHLFLIADYLPHCTYFLHHITTRHLSHITIEYTHPASPKEITAFIESLSASHQNHRSLKKIRLVDETRLENAATVIPLPSDVFRPLLNFTGLLSVDFLGIGNYNLDNRFINDIPNAWPHIQELKFAAFRPAKCGVSFAAMVSLASRCRSLQSLHLTFDASQPTMVPQGGDGMEMLWPAQTALRELHVGHSAVSEVSRMSFILGNVFPALTHLKWEEYYGSFDVENPSVPALIEVYNELDLA